MSPSQAKWKLSSSQSVLVLVGLQNFRMFEGVEDSPLMQNLLQVTNKAKALSIPMVDLYGDDLMQGMQQLGEYASTHPQLIFAGQVTPTLKQIIPYLQSVTEQICVVDDAILLNNQEQHIQWIENISQQNIHHMSSYNLSRLWRLRASSDYILSTKGILLAIAEQLNMDALEIDPTVSLAHYGLDTLAVMNLVELWCAHGVNISDEHMVQHASLQQLLPFLLSIAGE